MCPNYTHGLRVRVRVGVGDIKDMVGLRVWVGVKVWGLGWSWGWSRIGWHKFQ